MSCKLSHETRELSKFSTAILVVVLCYGILTLWVPQRLALSLYQIAAFGLVSLRCAWLALRPVPIQTSVLLVPLCGALLCGSIQLAAGLSIYPWRTLNSLLDWATFAALFFVALQVGGDRELRQRFLQALLYFGFALSVLATLQMFTSDGKIFWLFPSGYTDFVLGPFVYRNQYAAFIEMVLPLTLYRAVTDRRAASCYWVMAAIMVASVIAGASRAGAFLVLLEVIVIPAIAMRRASISGRALALGWGQFVLLAVVCSVVVGWDVLWTRFQQTDPYMARKEMMLSSVQMLCARPWTGFGLGTWSTAYPAYALFDSGLFVNQAHNDWIQWAVEGGVPFLFLMAAFAVLLVRPAFRSIWGLGLISVLLHCAVDYPMQQRPALAGWYFAMAGVLAAFSRNVPLPGTRSEEPPGRAM